MESNKIALGKLVIDGTISLENFIILFRAILEEMKKQGLKSKFEMRGETTLDVIPDEAEAIEKILTSFGFENPTKEMNILE